MVESKQANREHNKDSFEVFKTTCTALNKTPAQLTTMLGYSPYGYSPWLATGEMPKVAALLCQALVRENQISSKTDQVWIIRVPSGKQEGFGQLVKALGLEYLQA